MACRSKTVLLLLSVAVVLCGLNSHPVIDHRDKKSRRGKRSDKRSNRVSSAQQQGASVHDVSSAQKQSASYQQQGSSAQQQVSSAQHEGSSGQQQGLSAQQQVSSGQHRGSSGQHEVSSGHGSSGQHEVSSGQHEGSSTHWSAKVKANIQYRVGLMKSTSAVFQKVITFAEQIKAPQVGDVVDGMMSAVARNANNSQMYLSTINEGSLEHRSKNAIDEYNIFLSEVTRFEQEVLKLAKGRLEGTSVMVGSPEECLTKVMSNKAEAEHLSKSMKSAMAARALTEESAMRCGQLNGAEATLIRLSKLVEGRYVDMACVVAPWSAAALDVVLALLN